MPGPKLGVRTLIHTALHAGARAVAKHVEPGDTAEPLDKPAGNKLERNQRPMPFLTADHVEVKRFTPSSLILTALN